MSSFLPSHQCFGRITTATRVVCAFATCTLVACVKPDSAGRQQLGASSTAAVPTSDAQADASVPKLPLAAMNALEAGNTAYRAKQFDQALASYRVAASAAPNHAAPWFGMYMVATAMKNSALADSAMGRVTALAADPAALNAHAEVTSPMPTGGALPPGHPATPQLPLGHPTPATPGRAADSLKRGRAS